MTNKAALRNYNVFLTKNLNKFPRNSRTHSKEQINKIVRSIGEFGFTNPLLIDENNNIIAGHGRLEAALILDMKELPCIVLEGLSDEQKAALVIADNKIALDAGWDFNILQGQFEFLKQSDYDLTLTGFDLEELCEIFPDELPEAFCGEDDLPTVMETKAQLGDIWLLGDHRLLCGDSTVATDVERLLNGQKADMVFTDPPYGMNYKSNWKNSVSDSGILNDDKYCVNWLDVIVADAYYIFCRWDSFSIVEQKLKTLAINIHNVLIWNKQSHTAGDLKSWANTYEMIVYAGNKKSKLKGARPQNILSFRRLDNGAVGKNIGDNMIHPTQKPVEIIDFIINKHSHNNIIDLFGGSGSTLIACEKLKRKCFMMELDNTYVDVIIKRYQNYTGKDAIHEESGKTWNQLSREMMTEVKT